MINSKLRTWRTKAGLTLDEVARRVGIAGRNPRSTFRRLEIGQHWPDPETVEAIVRVTDGAVTVEDLHRARLAYLKNTHHGQNAAPAAASQQGECA